jgi:DNA (cytosine-5)-methyltransferase 1
MRRETKECKHDSPHSNGSRPLHRHRHARADPARLRSLIHMPALYVDIDPHACEWLRNLVSAGVIAPGDVWLRDIRDITPNELVRYDQCHFFAGIGVWSYALRRAGWRDDRRVWTGSCPCFPEGALVLTRRGYVPIEAVRVGDEVLTHKARWRKVSHVGSDFSEVVVVKGQGHFGLECTPTHPFLVGGDEWELAENLAGRRWATVAKVPTGDGIPSLTPTKAGYFFDRASNGYRVKGYKNGKPVYVGLYRNESDAAAARTEAVRSGVIDVRGADAVDTSSLGFARFLGYWVGDGWTSGTSVIAICGAQGDGDLLAEIMAGAGIVGSASKERTSARHRCGSADLVRWLRDHFGAGADKKRIPAWLHAAPEDYRQAFLDGYWEADGHDEMQSNGDGTIRRFTTVSKALAVGVRVLLNQAGKSASITRHTPARENTIEGRSVSERPFYRVTAYERARSFAFSGDHGWGLVRSVEPLGVARRVFNIAVDEDESYTVDGIVVHNCQPFSSAGRGGGFADERHLWPAWHWLIEQCRPDTIFGEQVASKDGLAWFDLVLSDLEGSGYAVGVQDSCAAGFGSPNIRQRLFFVADACRERREGERLQLFAGQPRDTLFEAAGGGGAGIVADSAVSRWDGRSQWSAGANEWAAQEPRRLRDVGELADSESLGLLGRQDDGDSGRWERTSGQGCEAGELGDASRHGEWEHRESNPSRGQQVAAGGSGVLGELADASSTRLEIFSEQSARGQCSAVERGGAVGRPGPTNGLWRDADWLFCTDGKWRPVESGSFPLVDGAAFRVGSGGPFEGKSRAGMLKGYGNAINAEVAAEFIRAFIDFDLARGWRRMVEGLHG